MFKSYSECLSEINSEELYEGLLGYGLFTNKLPPVFSSKSFCNFCKLNRFTSENDGRKSIDFYSMKYINQPRQFSIPNPFAYERLCDCIKNNWNDILDHFNKNTREDKYKISRIHLRKLSGEKCLFEMNYNNWIMDDSPEIEYMLGSEYLVKADISNCFGSIYTHSISWAIAGTKVAKENKNIKSKWYNKLDKCVSNCNYGQTKGILVGPHAFNLISEIILTNIDKHLREKGWNFIRYIDDYSCYVKNSNDAHKFLIDLSKELRGYELVLNHKKTSITKLSTEFESNWINKINSLIFIVPKYKDEINYIGIKSFLDYSLMLMKENNYNVSIINYAIKIISNQKLTNNAKNYYIKYILYLAYIYPYLVSLMDEFIFQIFDVDTETISNFANKIYDKGHEEDNFEIQYFAIYLAIKYKFEITKINVIDFINCDNCMLKTFAYLYYNQKKQIDKIDYLYKHAKELKKHGDFSQNWLFVYEVLKENDLENEWKNIKSKNVTFIDYKSLN